MSDQQPAVSRRAFAVVVVLLMSHILFSVAAVIWYMAREKQNMEFRAYNSHSISRVEHACETGDVELRKELLEWSEEYALDMLGMSGSTPTFARKLSSRMQCLVEEVVP